MSTFVKPTDIVPVTLVRSAQMNNLASAVETAFGLLPNENAMAAGTTTFGACTSTATDAYIVTLENSVLSEYIDGMVVCFRAITTNTGACTINVVTSIGALGVKSMKRHSGDTLSAGDILSGKTYTFRYNASTNNFELQTISLSEITGETTITVTSSLADDPDPTLSANLKVGSRSLVDLSGNELLKFNPQASSVNEITIRNAATMTGPIIGASGSDTNIDIVLNPKGSGSVNLEDNQLKRAKIIDYSEVCSTVSSSAGELELDLETGNQFVVTLTENITTFTISNFTTGAAASATLYLTQASSAKTVDWSNMGVLWDSGVSPDLTTNDSKHVLAFTSPDGGATVFGVHVLKNAAASA